MNQHKIVLVLAGWMLMTSLVPVYAWDMASLHATGKNTNASYWLGYMGIGFGVVGMGIGIFSYTKYCYWKKMACSYKKDLEQWRARSDAAHQVPSAEDLETVRKLREMGATVSRLTGQVKQLHGEVQEINREQAATIKALDRALSEREV